MRGNLDLDLFSTRQMKRRSKCKTPDQQSSSVAQVTAVFFLLPFNADCREQPIALRASTVDKSGGLDTDQLHWGFSAVPNEAIRYPTQNPDKRGLKPSELESRHAGEGPFRW
jgi:hypothetical protein